jgi:3-oxoacyl-(acyl-carrier-protein) synthase
MHNRRVVITGLGLVTPVGIGRLEVWKAITAGTSGTRTLSVLPTDFPVENLRSRVVANVPNSLFTSSDLACVRARHFLFGTKALQLALEDAGVDSLALANSGMVFGNAVGGTTAMEEAFVTMDCGGVLDPTRAPVDLADQFSFHSLSAELAARSGVTGPVVTVSTGCTAGLDAIGMTFEMIRSGEIDVAVTGSSETPITPVVFAAFDVIGALTKHNENPQTASRPFDHRRDGFVLGEGAAVLLLEEWGHAKSRNAPVYCEITGYASNSNAYHMTDLPEQGAGLADCIRLALQDAGIQPGDVDHVNAHGSSTPQNDICETNAIKQVLGDHAYSVPVNSLKSMVGHALGASNAIEVAACAMSIHESFLFPTINLEKAGKGCDLDYVPNYGRHCPLRNVLKLSNGFSGIHSAMVLTAA